MYLCGEFGNNGDWRAGRILIQHNIRRTKFNVNLDNSYREEQSDAYAMRLHSVHPIGFFSRQSRAYIEIYKGVRFFYAFFSSKIWTLYKVLTVKKNTHLLFTPHFQLLFNGIRKIVKLCNPIVTFDGSISVI